MKPQYPKEDLSESKTDGDKHNDQTKTIVVGGVNDEINEKLATDTSNIASAIDTPISPTSNEE